MIKFFRRIRQQLLSEGKIGKYLTYAIGEIVLVVIGILIALQINNWNDVNRQRQKEIIYLIELKKGLENDLAAEFTPATRKYKTTLERHKKLDSFYNNTKIFSNDSLSKYFRTCFRAEWDFVFNTATYENIKSAGIQIISNDSIRTKISSLYSYSYPNILEVNQNYIRYYDLEISPIIFDNINLSNHTFTPSELDFLKNSIQISNRLRHLQSRRSFLYRRLLVPVEKIVESLIDDIELEIQQLKN